MTPILYVGNKNYSSWSMRPWLALKWARIPFDEVVVELGGDGYGKGEMPSVLAISPSGRVPALALGGTSGNMSGDASGEVIVWDSLAICEWAAETAPSLFPADPNARAVCRSVVAEMHSGLAAMRRDLAMNIRRRTTPRDWPEDTRADLKRVERIWTTTRARYGQSGPMLFGVRTIADAFFAPVATRLRTYGVPISPASSAYCAAIFGDDAFQEWEAAALKETAIIASTEAL